MTQTELDAIRARCEERVPCVAEERGYSCPLDARQNILVLLEQIDRLTPITEEQLERLVWKIERRIQKLSDLDTVLPEDELPIIRELAVYSAMSSIDAFREVLIWIEEAKTNDRD